MSSNVVAVTPTVRPVAGLISLRATEVHHQAVVGGADVKAVQLVGAQRRLHLTANKAAPRASASCSSDIRVAGVTGRIRLLRISPLVCSSVTCGRW